MGVSGSAPGDRAAAAGADVVGSWLLTNHTDPAEALEMAQRIWTPEVCADEREFRAACDRVHLASFECYGLDNLHATKFLYRTLLAARPLATTESMLAGYEHTLAGTASVLTNWLVGLHAFDDALALIQEYWQLLDAKDHRRAALGLPPSPSTNPRLRLLDNLADIEWRLDIGEERRGCLPTPPQQIGLWQRYSARVREFMAENHHTEYLRSANVLLVLNAGRNVAAVARRFVPRQVPAILAEFDTWHRPEYGTLGLARPAHHWKTTRGARPLTIWYWQYELFKVWHAALQAPGGSPRRAAAVPELEELYEHLIGVARNWVLARSHCVQLAGIIRDRNWMREELSTRAGD